jgi:hypothetical protein
MYNGIFTAEIESSEENSVAGSESFTEKFPLEEDLSVPGLHPLNSKLKKPITVSQFIILFDIIVNFNSK